MTGRQAAQAGQLELDWRTPLGVAEIAARMRELDRALGTHLPPEVEVKTRRNRSTLGSLRLTRARPAVWRFNVAVDLLEQDPQAALELGLLLLHRARRREAPRELVKRLAEIRAGWSSSRSQRRVRASLADPLLCARLLAVAEQGWPGLEPGRLPAIVWAPSVSRRILGRYDSRLKRIELHEALRQPGVPTLVIDNLIFHELLHALLGPVRQGARLVQHHAEFRRRERSFHHYAEAEAWSRTTWSRVISRHLRRQS